MRYTTTRWLELIYEISKENNGSILKIIPLLANTSKPILNSTKVPFGTTETIE